MKHTYLFLLCCITASFTFYQHSFALDSYWQSPLSPNAGLITSIAAMGDNGEVLLIGTDKKGILRSTDNGQTWEQTSVASTKIWAMVVTPQGTIIAGADHIYRSTDQGLTWTQTQTSIAGALALRSNGDIYACVFPAGAIYRSTDDGQTWKYVNTQSAAAIAVNANGDIFAGQFEGVFRAKNGQSSYTLVTQENIWDLTLAIDEYQTIYAGTYGTVMSSTNNGDSWTSASGLGFSGDFSHALLCIPGQGTFTGGRIGIHRTQDRGQHWSRIPIDLPDTMVSAFAVDRKGRLLAAVGNNLFDDGICSLLRSAGPVTAVENIEAPKNIILEQNTPNPCQNETLISFVLDRTQAIRLSVIDPLGIERSILLEQTLGEGRHTVRWNTGNLAAGIYFYQLHTSSGTQTKQCVLMK